MTDQDSESNLRLLVPPDHGTARKRVAKIELQTMAEIGLVGFVCIGLRENGTMAVNYGTVNPRELIILQKVLNTRLDQIIAQFSVPI